MSNIFTFPAVVFLVLTNILIHHQAKAAVKLPSLIGNNMVLQQNSLINVWGWADAGEVITIKASWLTNVVTATTAIQGEWKTRIQTPAAGGPYTMEIQGRDNSIFIKDVLIGEVWVCSGQSNMEFTINNLGGWKNFNPAIKDEIDKNTFNQIRLFTVKRDTSTIALNNCEGNWAIPDRNTVSNFSATAWFFGTYLFQQINVPIGLISAAWGGTPAEVWAPSIAIHSMPEIGYILSHFNGSSYWPGSPGVLYNSMIHPLVNYHIKGVIWYQGETNRNDASIYPALMNNLISSWRNAWQNSEMPFFYVQIAPFKYKEPFSGSLLREAQLKCLTIPHTGMAVTMDLVDDINDIHPVNKVDVGKRLALWAMSKTYNIPVESFSGPVYEGMEIQDKSIVIRFLYADNGLRITTSGLTNFLIAGADQVFYPANVKIENTQLVISSPKVKRPLAVRYAFTNTSEATLFNGKGLPASSFRTDNWEVITNKILLNPFYDPDTKSVLYTLTTTARESDIRYEFDKLPSKNSPLFFTPISNHHTGKLFATISRNGILSGTSNSWELNSNKASGSEINFVSQYSEKYASYSNITLTDGILATKEYGDGHWLGFESNDLEVVIDFGKVIKLKKVRINFLSDNKSWIFLPKEVEVQVSTDGVSYKNMGTLSFANDKELQNPVIQNISFKKKSTVRYLRVKALNQKICPDWHPGKGNKCWLFVDEILIE